MRIKKESNSEFQRKKLLKTAILIQVVNLKLQFLSILEHKNETTILKYSRTTVYPQILLRPCELKAINRSSTKQLLSKKVSREFLIHLKQRMKYRFRHKGEVYHTLHNLFEEGGAAQNIRKNYHRLPQIKKFVQILPIPFNQSKSPVS